MNKKDIILVIGSSMTMPRLEVGFFETWLYFLMMKYPDCFIIDKSRRASTTNRLVNDGAGYKDTRRGADLLEYYTPKVVITQIGITDCAPRLLNKSKKFTKILNLSPNFIKTMTYKVIKKIKIRTIENADVSILEFEKNWQSYIERAKKLNTQILCVLISKPTSLVTKKSPEIKKAIELYNTKLIKFSEQYDNFNVLEPYKQDEIDLFAIDEFHVNADGHKCLFQKLDVLFRQILANG